MIGAAADASVPGSVGSDSENARYASAVAQMHTLGARHFSTGMNSYFFALAAIAWFLNPLLFIVATIWVSLVLYRRAFRSQFAKILEGLEDNTAEPGS